MQCRPKDNPPTAIRFYVFTGVSKGDLINGGTSDNGAIVILMNLIV